MHLGLPISGFDTPLLTVSCLTKENHVIHNREQWSAPTHATGARTLNPEGARNSGTQTEIVKRLSFDTRYGDGSDRHYTRSGLLDCERVCNRRLAGHGESVTTASIADSSSSSCLNVSLPHPGDTQDTPVFFRTADETRPPLPSFRSLLNLE